MPNNNHYLGRVPPEHKRPNFMRWLAANLEPLLDDEKLLTALCGEFDLDRAVGEQLNTTGAIVGRNRLLDFQPSDGSSPLLDDETYRVLQKAKISINHWDGTIPDIYRLWDNLFPEYQLLVQDNQDMTMDLYVLDRPPQLVKELMARGYIAPKPEGVRVNFEFTYSEEFHGEIYHGITYAQANHYIFFPYTELDYNVENKHQIGAAQGVSHHYTMYDRVDEEIAVHDRLRTGSVQSTNHNYTMYDRVSTEYDIQNGLKMGASVAAHNEYVLR